MPDAEELEMMLDRRDMDQRRDRSFSWKKIMEPSVEQDALDEKEEEGESH